MRPQRATLSLITSMRPMPRLLRARKLWRGAVMGRPTNDERGYFYNRVFPNASRDFRLANRTQPARKRNAPTSRNRWLTKRQLIKSATFSGLKLETNPLLPYSAVSAAAIASEQRRQQ